ncbi:MAG: acetyl esterase [Spirosoma sp.]|nr:acetyl esterase [Spirosoma sp.]
MVSNNFFTEELSDPRFESNGLRYITIKSTALKSRGDITVFVPAGELLTKNLPVVILLHGVYGSHWAWSSKAGVHLTAQKLIDSGQIKPMILAMPSDGLFRDGSGYLNQNQTNYEDWIVQDVRLALINLIPSVSSESVFFISGLSMGGYGALRLGAKYPQVFKSFSGLSSITEFDQIGRFYEPETFHELADAVIQPESVLENILLNREKIGPFRFDCGQDDELIKANRALHTALKKHGITHVFEELTGQHDWAYWEKAIGKSLIFFSSL